jgi:hypothetical protein
MPLKYLHVCLSCGEAFDNEINTPKEESYCPHCEMLPETGQPYHADAEACLTPGGTRTIITEPKEGEEKYVETIQSGMTGQHIKGTSNLKANKPHSRHVFKKKPCKKCKKIFQPTSGNDVYCATCKPLSLVKSKQAKLYLQEQETPHPGRGRHVNKPDRIALEKLATGLISEPRDLTGVSTKATVHYMPGMNLLKPQKIDEPLEGLWIKYKEAGLTHDKRQYVVSKEIITGAIAVDLWSPRERYISDSTAASLA